MSIVKFFLEIILITNALLRSAESAEIQSLCDKNTGIIRPSSNIRDQYKFTSEKCHKSRPKVLVLKFNSRRSDCRNKPSQATPCYGRSYLQVNGEVVFSTCQEGVGNCYIFTNAINALDMLSEFECKFYAVRIYKQLPIVELNYDTCYTSFSFALNYTYVVKDPDPTTTPISSNFTTTQNTSKSEETTEQSSKQPPTTIRSTSPCTPDATTAQLRSASTNFNMDSTWESNAAANTFPLERILSIVFGALFLITLLAMVVLSIKYQRLKSESVNENDEKGEVVVNQIYDSFHDQAPEAESVENELYGTA